MPELWFGCFEYYHAYRSGNTVNECLCVAKSVAHLMKFYLLQWEVVKVKFLMNSNMTLTVLNPSRCTPTLPNQCPYQVSTSYTLQFLRYSPDKLFPATRPHSDTMGENNTPTALKGCGVKNIWEIIIHIYMC